MHPYQTSIVLTNILTFKGGIEESLGTHMPAGFMVTRSDDDISLFSAATMGLDPFGKEDDPFMGHAKTTTPESATTVEMLPVQTAYHGAAGVQSPIQPPVAGSYTPPQQPVSSPHVYYNTGTDWRAQQPTWQGRPWEHWNSTGW
jgi:hypothetical protein